MKYLVAALLMLSMFTPVQAQKPLPHIPGTELQWGMPYQEAREILPGQFEGFMLIRQQSFAGMPDTHPVIGQYYFSAQQELIYAQFTPFYHYNAHPEHWQDDYDHITSSMTDIYGEPVHTQQQDDIIWQSESTQGRFRSNFIHQGDQRIDTGWSMRFDPLQQEEEE